MTDADQIRTVFEEDHTVIEIDAAAIAQVVVRIKLEPAQLEAWQQALGLSKVGMVRIPALGEFTVTQVRLQSKVLIAALAPTRDA